MDQLYDDDVLEPLPVYEHGVAVPPAPVGVERRLASRFRPRRQRAERDAESTIMLSAVEMPRFSATFTRLANLHPALLADLPHWWGRRSSGTRLRVTRQLVLEPPKFGASGTWRLRGSLRSPWLRRQIPVELQLWPCLGSWTKVCLEPQRRVRLGRSYFNNGHRALDALTARLNTELHNRIDRPY